MSNLENSKFFWKIFKIDISYKINHDSTRPICKNIDLITQSSLFYSPYDIAKVRIYRNS